MFKEDWICESFPFTFLVQLTLHFAFVDDNFSRQLLAFLASLGSLLDSDIKDGTRWCLNFMIIMSFVVAEYFANRWMRKNKDSCFVFKTFGAAVFSSFYNLLCVLSAFKDGNLFSKTVDFKRFLKEHRARFIISIVLSIIAVLLAVINLMEITSNYERSNNEQTPIPTSAPTAPPAPSPTEYYPVWSWSNDADSISSTNSRTRCSVSGDHHIGSYMVFVFIFFFFIALWINKWTMKWIHRSALVEEAKVSKSVAADHTALTLHSAVDSDSVVSPTETIQSETKEQELVPPTDNQVL